jgi:hypothetical protein
LRQRPLPHRVVPLQLRPGTDFMRQLHNIRRKL